MCRRILAGVLVAIFLPIFCVFLITLSAKFTVVSPNYYKNQLEKLNFYDKIVNDLAPIVLQGITSSDKNSGQSINTDELSKSLKDIISPDQLKSTVNIFLSSLDKYLNGQSNAISGKIDLREFKKKAGDFLEITMKAQINNLPTCTPDQLKEEKSQKQDQMPPCLPEGTDKSKMISELKISDQQKQDFVKTIPDEFDLASYFDSSKNPQNAQLLQKAKMIVGYFNLSIIILAVLSLLIILFICLLVWKPLADILKWLGITVIIPSSIVFLTTLGIILSVKGIVLGFASGLNLPAQAIQIVQQLSETLVNGANYNLLLISLVFLSISIGLLIWASQIKKHAS